VRAALAAGRIGNEGSLAELSNLLGHDEDQAVREMAAFAIGEVESLSGANALLAALKSSTETRLVRARAIEGLGKIAAALPKEQQARSAEISTAILEALNLEMQSQSPNHQFILLGITAVLRSRPANAGQTLTLLLDNKDARIRADAANALARSRAKDGNNKLANLLESDPDPDVRANAARVLGATEEKSAFEKLLASATHDEDARVRVSAIRALATLKDSRASEALLKYGTSITERHLKPLPAEQNEVLEVATALGRLYAMKADSGALDWLHEGQVEFDHSAPEVELAYVRISPERYLSSFGSDQATAQRALQEKLILNWRSGASIAQALSEIANLPTAVENKSDLM